MKTEAIDTIGDIGIAVATWGLWPAEPYYPSFINAMVCNSIG